MTTMSKKASERVVTERKPKIWTPGQIILMIVILIFSLTCLLPFVNVAAVSFSSKSAILRGDVSFWPVEFNTTAYEAIFSDKSMIHSLVYSHGIEDIPVLRSPSAIFFCSLSSISPLAHYFLPPHPSLFLLLLTLQAPVLLNLFK